MALQIQQTDIVALNTKIKTLFNGRKNPIEGGINVATGTGRKTAPVNFSPAPAVGAYIKADAYNKTFGALNQAGMIFDNTLNAVSATAGTYVPTEVQYTNALNFVNTHSSDNVSTTTKANSGCNAYCTGLCSGTCWSNDRYGEPVICSTCEGGCAGDCGSSCGGGCRGLCANDCSGTCARSGSANASCDACHFVGCTSTCMGNCGNNCDSNCSVGCGNNCKLGCNTGCKSGCTNSSTAA